MAVSGSAASPVILRRDRITLVEDESVREAYHAAAGVPLAEAPAVIESVEVAATAAAAEAVRDLASALDGVVAVGVVGGGRRLPDELPKRLATHALLHASERVLYEQAVIRGATDAGLPVTTLPATGKLLEHASDVLGVPLGPAPAGIGEAVGPPWQKDHKEATAAALVALASVG